MVAVVIPITNKPYYLDHIQECLESIRIQTKRPQVIIVEDGPCPIFPVPSTLLYKRVFIPARVGVPNAFNIGVATAFNMGQSKVLMMGCDDVLTSPQAIDILDDYITGDGYYWLDQLEGTGNIRSEPSGHAVITKAFWERIGGYPLEAPEACDGALISMIWGTPDLIHVETYPPLIHVNRSSETYTGSRDPRWLPIILQTRELLTTLYKERTGVVADIAPMTL